MIGIITLYAYWHKVTNPVINVVVVVDADKKLVDIIADEVAKKKSTADVVIARDLKSAKSFGGKDINQLLDHPFSTFYNVIGAETQKELHIVFNTPIPPQKPKPAASFFDVLMQKAKPAKNLFKSTHTLENVEKFISGYAEANNKEKYLKNYDGKKPTITEQHEAYAAEFLNKKNLTYSSGSGGEEAKAKSTMSKLVHTAQFLTENRPTLSKNQVQKYESSELLEMSARCISAKVKPNAKKKVTVQLLQKELRNAESLLQAFPSSWWKVIDEDTKEKEGEAAFSEVELMRDIIATNIRRLQDQQAINHDAKTKAPTKPSPFNTETSIMKAYAFSAKPMSEAHKNLCQQMKSADAYSIFHLTDEMMKIDEGSNKTPQQRSKARKRFVELIKFPFNVAVFKFQRQGTLGDWVAVCKLKQGDTKASDGFVGFVTAASREAPLLLSCRQTRDAVNVIATATGKSKRLSRAILSTSLPDGTLPQFDTSQEETEIFEDISKIILQLQCDEVDAMDAIVDDMRRFNGKADITKFDTFWKGATEVLENQNGSGAHVRRHAASDEQTTIDVQYAPGILSIPQLVRDTQKYLTEEKKLTEGVDFKVPSLSWVYLQLSPNNEFKHTASRYTGRIPFKLMLQTRDARDFSHVCAHWVSAMKKLWRHEMSLKYDLISKYINSGDDDTVPCLPPQHAIMCLGDDDKASAPVGRTIPVSATGKQSSRAIVQESSSASDHDWASESLAMTVLQHMNITENPNDSQYSGGKEGTGFVTVSVHDRTLNPSTGLQHSVNIYDFILRQAKKRCNIEDADDLERLKRFFPLILHIETDGGPDHNFTFLRNTMALFGLFLICDVDKMTATRCCPGLSFLNIVERAMSLINMGISALSLAIDPNADKFLLDEVIKGMTSMKNVRESISDYDKAVKVAIQILERQLKKTTAEDCNEQSSDMAVEDDANNNSSITSKVGDEVMKFFPFFGTFKGRVTEINKDDADGKFIRIRFEDGEVLDFSQQEVDEFTVLSSIPIGELGFQFIRKFGTAGYFNGIVIEKKRSGKYLCRFNDGAEHEYTLTQLEVYAMQKAEGTVDDESDTTDTDTDESSSSEESGEESSSSDDGDDDAIIIDTTTAATATAAAATATSTATTAGPQKSVGAHFNRHLTNLKRVPAGTNAEAWLNELKDRRSAQESFTSAMDFPKEQIEARCRNLTLDGRPVEVMEYPTKEDCTIILDALKKFDPDFNESYTSMSQLKMMPLMQQFLSCPQHCRRTDFSLEFRLCGNVNCSLCKKVGRSVRTPNVEVNGINLRDEVLRFNPLPIPDPTNPDHFMPPAAAREHIESNKLTLEDMKKFIPDAKLDRGGKKMLQWKEKDKKHNWHASKVRTTAQCRSCGATRCIYSNNMVGKSGGPTTEDLETLERAIEKNGYLCGDKMSGHDGGKSFYSRRAIRCCEPIEAHFYDPKAGQRGGRLVTSAAGVMCATCYETDNIVSKDEIRRERDLGGKTPLPMCRDCFEAGVKPPCSGARTNLKQATMQKKQKKRRQKTQTVRAGRRKVTRR